ncbi:MAG: class I SAM-dependent methyltransferase [Solirubrobacteraceae bacterium]
MSDQRRLNERVWSAATAAMQREYGRAPVRDVERQILADYAGDLSGRVLEIGVGSGRLTQLLAATAGELHGIDISPVMVEHCRATFPQATFSVADLSDLSAFADASLDAIVAGYNVLDVLDHEERAAALAEWARPLRPGGLLVVSSHNLHHGAGPADPGRLLARRPGTLLRNVLHRRARLANRARLAPLERREPAWAILNDEAHDFSLLHYYVTPGEMAAQLTGHGFTPLECRDLEGRAVTGAETAAGSSELHYVARRATA